MEANAAAAAAGLPPPHIFTKTFFDAFVALGGCGSTLCLAAAVFLSERKGAMSTISKFSLLPGLFNINEMLVFGLPIVLNPVFLVPFLLTPLAQCALAYAAIASGLVPHTTVAIAWTAPPFIGGYAATGSWTGAALQLAGLAAGCLVYLPFVRAAGRMKRESLNSAFRELMPGYAEAAGDGEHVLSPAARALSRSLAEDLSQALRRNELSLEYQPQVESTTGRVFGVEALMRWNHSRLGRIPPGLFIALAEESDLIRSLGSWALDEGCRQWSEWRRRGAADVVMSVNLSTRQLEGGGMPDEIAALLRKHSIPENMLEVEVTEGAALGGGAAAAELHRIHSLGVRLAIDDFGMGHSSLTYLKRFPVDTLKIDRILSHDVVTSRSSSEIVATVSELCRSLGIDCLVEYVDSEEQLRALQSIGCTRIQGWLYSPSLPPDQCLAFIRKGARIY
jgi:EAL domain-containing protein (putative c-di-GMP-specific phosphodiesterase class I)